MSRHLPTAVYTAWRGYEWSRVPSGMTRAELEGFYRLAVARRPQYAADDAVAEGVVSDGRRAAFFSVRTVPAWDSVGRAAEYCAFAFLPAADVPRLDVRQVLADSFFHTPERNPPESIEVPDSAELVADTSVALDAEKLVAEAAKVNVPKAQTISADRVTELEGECRRLSALADSRARALKIAWTFVAILAIAFTVLSVVVSRLLHSGGAS